MSRDHGRRPGGASQVERGIWRVVGGRGEEVQDSVTVEEPLEIRLAARQESRTLAVTMRTPGHDPELALGFLYAERVIRTAGEVEQIRILEDPLGIPGEPSNVLEVGLATDALPDLARLERHFFTTSACGICGRAGIENLRLEGYRVREGGPRFAPATLEALPERLRSAQGVFASTGGLHAAAFFGADGELRALREDVGRHNAMDKLIGWALRHEGLPLFGGVILVSGRTSYELVQKALAAGASTICGVSAPSSLAVDLAREFGLTLVGFLRGDRFNVYSEPSRIIGLE